MIWRKNREESTELTTGKEKQKRNPWRKYGALVMAGVLLAGVSAGTAVSLKAGAADAEEESPRVSLNIAGAEEETEAMTEEESSRVSLNIAGEEETESEASFDENIREEDTEILTEAETEEETETETETETEEDTETETETEAAAEEETGAEIGTVDVTQGAIVTTDVTEIVEKCMPSIVSITNVSVEEIQTYYDEIQEIEEESCASGIIVAQNDEELLIATNSHVVDGATELTVGFSVEAEDAEDLVVPAKIKGMDRDYELAVIAISLSDIEDEIREQLKIATLGSSDSLKVGEAAIAIGNSLGYGQSVTSGIISALNRELTIDNFSKEVILTDAAINFGNSGGALLNSRGEVIGINLAKEIGTAAEGMGYSIPIDTAIPVLETLINKETRDKMDNSERGYIGATVVNVTDDAEELYNIPAGAFVSSVEEGSAAEEAGIRRGDIITKFDGETVSSSSELIEKMSYYSVGETVTIEVQTANNGTYESREVEVTLQEGSQAAEEEDQKSYQEDNSSGEDDYEDDSYGFNFFPFGNSDIF